jgi:O-antigen biosynthesis protein
MKVYFISSGFDGCYYVRSMIPLQENAWWGEWTTLHGKRDTQEKMIEAAKSADVVVFQRPMKDEHYQMALALKAMGKKIVMDNDDTYRSDSGTPLAMVGIKSDAMKGVVDTINARLARFGQLADLITVSTPFLAKEYSEINRTIVLPNLICEDDWDKPLRNEGKKVRIGLSGSVGYSEDYLLIKDALTELSKRDDVQIVVFALPPDTEKYQWQRDLVYKDNLAFFTSIGAEFQPIVPMSEYIDTLNDLKLDIMLIPRQENYFNRCKSNVKFLESAMLEIPCVVSSFEDGPYESDLALKAKTPEDWMVHVEWLMDKKNRRKLGKEARKCVLKNYNIKDHAHKWEEAYKNLYANTNIQTHKII